MRRLWYTLTLVAALGAAGSLAGDGYAADSSDSLKAVAAEFAPLPGMTSEFSHLVQRLKAADAKERDTMRNSLSEERFAPIFRLKGTERDMVESYVWLTGWDPGMVKDIEAFGGEVTGQDESRYLLQAWLPLDSIEEIAVLPGVRQLRRPSYGIPSAGSVRTTGDSSLQANYIRNLGGVNGVGIRVGVISVGLFDNSFSSRTPSDRGSNSDNRVQSGDLPEFDPVAAVREVPTGPSGPLSHYFGNILISPSSFPYHDLSEDNFGGNAFVPEQAEGAMILETIHDLAPGASLYYGDGRTDVDVLTRRQWLLHQGVDVIVDNMIFFDSGRYDGSSAISRNAQQIAVEKDVVYVVSTGNYTPPSANLGLGLGVAGTRFPIYVNGYFSPRPGLNVGKWHNFAVGNNPASSSEVLRIMPQNGLIDVVLVWDDIWDDTNPSAQDDLDLYLFHGDLLNLADVVDASVDIQNASGRPIERISFYGPTSGEYSIAINRKDTFNSGNRLFTLLVLQGIIPNQDINHLTHGVPLNNADALPPVISVGPIDSTVGVSQVPIYAVPGLAPGPGRDYRNDFVKWFEGQKSPAVVSYSNTRTRTGVFTGASAGAAHIGGLVTLLRASYRQIPSYDFFSILRETTPPTGRSFANATPLMKSTLDPFVNKPSYLRVNGLDSWENIQVRIDAGELKRTAVVSTTGAAADWAHSDESVGYTPPAFDETPQGLSLSPGGNMNVFGYWQTPLIQLADGQGGTTSKLDSNSMYVITARVGSDEDDPAMVPTFRIRAITGGMDEAAVLWVAGLNRDTANAPTTIGGKEYKIYYRPSNQAVAEQGISVALDLVHFEEHKNSNATLFLQDLSVEEVALPE